MLCSRRSLVLAVALAAFLCGMAGCGPRSRAIQTSIPPAKIRPLESRIDAVPGRTLVIPVALEGAIDSRRPLGAHLDDGRRIAAAIHWISVSPSSAGAGGWLAPAGAWSATPLAASTLPSGAGGWVISVDLPLDCIGQGFWVSDQRIALNWLGDPGAGRAVPWRPIDEAAHWPQLLRIVEPEALSPVRRWRYRLLTLGPQGLAWGWEGEAPPAMSGRRCEPLADPVLEAMARQDEARWAAALSVLWMSDAD